MLLASATPAGVDLPMPAAAPMTIELADPVFTVTATDFAPGLLG